MTCRPWKSDPSQGVERNKKKKERDANARKNRKNPSKMRPDFPGGLATITSRRLGVHRAVPVRRAGLLDRDFRFGNRPPQRPCCKGPRNPGQIQNCAPFQTG